MRSVCISKMGLVGHIIGALITVGAVTYSVVSSAQTENTESNDPFVEEAVITGKHPGPAMWKIEKDGHVLWIYGVMNQLPHSVDWDSTRAERIVSESQGFIAPPRVRVVNKAGFFGSGKLNKEYERMQKLPEGQELSDVLPPELLASYQDAKERYAPENSDIDQLRPFFAAERLFFEAARTLDLRGGANIPGTLERVARRHEVPVISFNFEIPLESEIEELRHASMESEISCMQVTLDHINTDLKLRPKRVDAWVDGNKEALERLAYTTQLPHNCMDRAIHGEVIQRVRSQWLSAATEALETNVTTFAFLPVHQILAPNGLVPELLSRGYSLADKNASGH